MLNRTIIPFTHELQSKVDLLKSRRVPLKIGSVDFNSNLLLAPLSAICTAPFRLMMEDLGAGGTISELISCHGINHGNQRTLDMLRLDNREQNVGIQLFGEDGPAMGKAIKVAEKYGPKFIDINMGCPVRKVVTKGGGSALLREPEKLNNFFKTLKDASSIPVSIKIRTGWDEDSLNADKVTGIAKDCGIEFVSVHGRTRTQQYRGNSNWNYIEKIATESTLPIIGNGDLHTAEIIRERMKKTNCTALMLGRGPLRNPFIFLESFKKDNENILFTPQDYLEVIHRLLAYMKIYVSKERVLLIQMRKHIVWMAAGYPGVATFRGNLFAQKTLDDVLSLSEEYFNSLGPIPKQINLLSPFMAGGHG